ncbi:uncharacterized protein VTP21DRAFT_951 [Calcarisporiella thermophila]|uniref:uncharacterized protein n=1 Tax=Calcarisporiella thermophila TaxID=911321 RepID=UPI00374401A6
MGTRNAPFKKTQNLYKKRRVDKKAYKTRALLAPSAVEMKKEVSKKKAKKLERALKFEQQRLAEKGKLALEVDMEDVEASASNDNTAKPEITPILGGSGTVLGGVPPN